MSMLRNTKTVHLDVLAVVAGALLATTSAMAGVVKVYWTDRDNATLFVTDLSGGGTSVLASGFGRLQDVDLDTSTGALYFADWGTVGPPGGQGSINRVNPDGTGLATVLNTNDAVHQLALDEGLQRIYFTRAVSYDDREISHVDTNGANYTVLFSGSVPSSNGWFYSGLALDAPNNLLYWGDIGVLTPAPPADGSVNRMTTSGAAVTQLTPHVDGRGRGFALDQASQTIFYTAHDPQMPAGGGGLFSYDIALGVETQLIDDPDTGYWDIEIDAAEQRIWWTDYGRGQIRSARFDGTDVLVELTGLSNPYGLALEAVAAADRTLVIKQGACPAPVNPASNGFTPMLLVGDTDFDVSQVTLASLELRRCDGIGDGVAPNMGPPGPGPQIVDLNHPNSDDVGCENGQVPCGCNDDQSSDGIDDLKLKFRTSDMAEAFMLDGESAGAEITLFLSGTLSDGSEFVAADCMRLVGNPEPPGLLTVSSNTSGVWIDATPLDLIFDGGGFAPFERSHPLGAVVTLTAPVTDGERIFTGWIINGVEYPYLTPTIVITVDGAATTAWARYGLPFMRAPSATSH